MKKQRGIILLFIISVLIVVVFIALIFSSVSKTYVSEAQVYNDNIKARFAAHSGVNFALAKLYSSLQENYISFISQDWVYNGEDLNLNGVLDPEEDVNNNGILDIYSALPEKALRPSFPLYKDFVSLKANYTPSSSKIPSPLNRSEYLTKSNELSISFILKVKDTTQTFNLNDPNPKLINMLKNLSELIEVPMSYEEVKHFVKEIQDKIVLTNAVLPSSLAFSKLRQFMSLYGKTLDKLLIPSAKKDLIGKNIISVRELLSENLKVGKRSPININIAPYEIIKVILKDLEGIYVEEDLRTPSSLPDLNKLNMAEQQLRGWLIPGFGDVLTAGSTILPPEVLSKIEEIIDAGFKSMSEFAVPRLQLFNSFKSIKTRNIYYGTVKRHKLSDSKSTQLAEIIFKKRYADINKPSFLNITEFHAFLEEQVKRKVINELDKDLILANCDINSDFNKFNPNKIFYKHIDKSDLLEYTTEIVFGPIGTFEIESVGIVERKGDVTARKTLINVYDVLKVEIDSTQKDFAQGIIKPNINPDYPTTANATLETYPEPSINNLHKENELDGQLMLATIKRELMNDHTFLASFDNSLNANYARDVPYLVTEYFKDKPDVRPPMVDSIFRKGTLYPDGIYTDLKTVYPYRGGLNLPFKNLASFSFNPDAEEFKISEFKVLLGIITFWVKANFETEEGEKTRMIFSSYSIDSERDRVDRILQMIFQSTLNARLNFQISRKEYKEAPLTTPFVVTDFTMPFLFGKTKKKTFFMPDPYFMLQDTVKIPPKYRIKSRQWKHVGILLDEEGAQFTVIY